MLTRNAFRKFSYLSFLKKGKSFPLLEELFQMPHLDIEKMTLEEINRVKTFWKPIVLPKHIQSSLQHEFGEHVMATDISQYEDPRKRADRLLAARILHFTLSVYNNRNKKMEKDQKQGNNNANSKSNQNHAPPPIASIESNCKDGKNDDNHNKGDSNNIFSSQLEKENWEWIEKESKIMQMEIETGDFSRWTEDAILKEIPSITKKQEDLLRPAAKLLSKEPLLHPRIRNDIMKVIAQVVQTTIKD